MCAKPLVGMNMDFHGVRGDVPAFSTLWSGYYDSIVSAGGIPIALPPVTDSKDITQVLNLVDAFVLVGGDDLDPRRQGYERHRTTLLMNNRRETFDRALIRQIAERKMPVLAIGAGMQLLNVYMGGTLSYNIEDDFPNAIPHRNKRDILHRHALEVVPDSLMGRIYGDGDIRVNSRHHQAVYDVAPGFKATGTCPDGIVEVIESQMDDWFAIGTQFHPECITATALDSRIFEEFLSGATGKVTYTRVLL